MLLEKKPILVFFDVIIILLLDFVLKLALINLLFRKCKIINSKHGEFSTIFGNILLY